MRNVLLISGIVIVGLIVTLAIVGRGDRWPAVEVPPRQGEALDATASREGRFVHSSEALTDLIREPQNTWSNLAFVFGGAYLVSCARLRGIRLLGIALIAVGIGSFLYHASASRTLRNLDVGAMYALFFVMGLVSLGSLRPAFRRAFEARLWSVSVGAIIFAVSATFARNVVIFGVKPISLQIVTIASAALMIACLVAAAARHRSGSKTVSAFGVAVVFGLAAACQLGDRPGGWLCAPESIIQGHALWHCLSAAALVLAARIIEGNGRSQRGHV